MVPIWSQRSWTHFGGSSLDAAGTSARRRERRVLKAAGRPRVGPRRRAGRQDIPIYPVAVGWLQFFVEMTRTLIWPVAVLVIALAYRQRIGDLLGGGLPRLRAGPFEAEWEAIAARTTAAVEPTEEGAERNEVRLVVDPLRRLARLQPAGAIVEAYGLVDRGMHDLLKDVPVRDLVYMPLDREYAWIALDRGLIDSMTATAIQGLASLRNLAAHVAQTISEERALSFLDLTEDVLVALRQARRGPRDGQEG